MKIFYSLLWLSIFSFSNLILANSYSSIHYKITPLSYSKIPAIKIDVEINGTLSNKIILDLPNAWAGVEYIDQVKNIEIVGLKNAFKIMPSV